MTTTAYEPVPVETIGSLSFEEYLTLATPTTFGVAPWPYEFAVILAGLCLVVAAIVRTAGVMGERKRGQERTGSAVGSVLSTATVFGVLGSLPGALILFVLMLAHEDGDRKFTGRSLAVVEQEYGLPPKTLDAISDDLRAKRSGSLVTSSYQRLVVGDLVFEPDQWGIQTFTDGPSRAIGGPGMFQSDKKSHITSVRVVIVEGNRMVDLREVLARQAPS